MNLSYGPGRPQPGSPRPHTGPSDPSQRQRGSCRDLGELPRSVAASGTPRVQVRPAQSLTLQSVTAGWPDSQQPMSTHRTLKESVSGTQTAYPRRWASEAHLLSAAPTMRSRARGGDSPASTPATAVASGREHRLTSLVKGDGASSCTRSKQRPAAQTPSCAP